MKIFICFFMLVRVSSFMAGNSRSTLQKMRTKKFGSPRIFPSMAAQCGIQFYPGKFEPAVPDVKLTRSKDGMSGIAYFYFDMPSFFEPNAEDVPEDAITGMTMVDEEGELTTSSVSAKFVNGKPTALECQYIMTDAGSWDRFMRFMDRYAEANGLGFSNTNKPSGNAEGPVKRQVI